MTTSEEWRPIPGWEEAYEVSNQGRVRNARTGLIRALQIDLSGRRHLSLFGPGGRSETKKVHRLVALAFLPPPLPTQTDVCHNDGNLANNAASNLRWDTHAGNMADIKRHGTGRNQHADKTHCARGHEFTPENTYVRKSWRACRACQRITQAAHRQRRRDRHAANNP